MKAALALLAAFAIAAPASAQSDDVTSRTQAVQRKMRDMDLIIQILPLSLTTEQIDPILSELEKIRAEQKKILENEDKDLLAFETKLDKTLEDAREKGKYPSKDAMAESNNLLRILSGRRSVARSVFIERVYKIVKDKLNDGQLTVMEKSLDPKLIDPTIKLEGREEKIRFFVRIVFMDPQAYDVLKKEYIRLKKGGEKPAKTEGEG
ncbi:hypothetical protein EON81_18740 [bacterium]|nr:MAG: hypothetical protein EON81_18740 [bacterium]